MRIRGGVRPFSFEWDGRSRLKGRSCYGHHVEAVLQALERLIGEESLYRTSAIGIELIPLCLGISLCKDIFALGALFPFHI